MAALCAV